MSGSRYLADASEALVSARDASFAPVRRLVETGQSTGELASGEVRRIDTLMFATLHGIATMANNKMIDPLDDELISDAVNSLLSGLAPSPVGSPPSGSKEGTRSCVVSGAATYLPPPCFCSCASRPRTSRRHPPRPWWQRPPALSEDLPAALPSPPDLPASSPPFVEGLASLPDFVSADPAGVVPVVSALVRCRGGRSRCRVRLRRLHRSGGRRVVRLRRRRGRAGALVTLHRGGIRGRRSRRGSVVRLGGRRCRPREPFRIRSRSAGAVGSAAGVAPAAGVVAGLASVGCLACGQRDRGRGGRRQGGRVGLGRRCRGRRLLQMQGIRDRAAEEQQRPQRTGRLDEGPGGAVEEQIVHCSAARPRRR